MVRPAVPRMVLYHDRFTRWGAKLELGGQVGALVGRSGHWISGWVILPTNFISAALLLLPPPFFGGGGGVITLYFSEREPAFASGFALA